MTKFFSLTCLLLSTLTVQHAKASVDLLSGRLNVGPNIYLAYTDSGKPSDTDIYNTIFAVHGMGFNASASLTVPC